jgi:2-oxoglutarate ferredoxin oxidoreductase subunit alpha
MGKKVLNILIGGEAGQGLQTVGPVFAKSLVRSGFSVHVTQTYESRIRGGHNTFAIRTDTEKVSAPQEDIDILIALNEETIPLHKTKLTPGGRIMGNEEWNIEEENWIGVPFKTLGKEMYWNTAAIGVGAGIIGLGDDVVIRTMRDAVGKGQVAEENRKVLEASYRWLAEQSFGPESARPPRRRTTSTHMCSTACTGGRFPWPRGRSWPTPISSS